MTSYQSRVDLAGIDQVAALAPGEIDAVPVFAVERKAGDGQRLALGAGLLDPIATAAGRIMAVADLGDDALKPFLAGVSKHLHPIDLEAFTELKFGPVDDLFKMLLALDQRQLAEVITVEIESPR